MSDEREKDRIAAVDRATDSRKMGRAAARTYRERIRLVQLGGLFVFLLLVLLSARGTPHFFPTLAIVSLVASIASGLFLLGRYWRRKMDGVPAHSRVIWNGAAICICIAVYITFTPTRCAVPFVAHTFCSNEELGLGAIPRWVNTSPD